MERFQKRMGFSYLKSKSRLLKDGVRIDIFIRPLKTSSTSFCIVSEAKETRRLTFCMTSATTLMLSCFLVIVSCNCSRDPLTKVILDWQNSFAAGIFYWGERERVWKGRKERQNGMTFSSKALITSPLELASGAIHLLINSRDTGGSLKSKTNE